MAVEIKDRVKEVEYLRMALAVSEFGVSYEQADLINEVVKEVQNKGGDFDLHDGVQLFYNWKNKWDKYYSDKENLKTEA